MPSDYPTGAPAISTGCKTAIDVLISMIAVLVVWL